MVPEEICNLLTNPLIPADKKEEILFETLNNSDITRAMEIFRNLQILWPQISSARISKIVRKTVFMMPYCNETLEFVDQLLEIFEAQKMLCLSLRLQKVSLLLHLRRFSDFFTITAKLQHDLKKYDDKINMIKLSVEESKAHYLLKNSVLARSSLTSARALSVGCYCPTSLLSNIDLLSGMYLCDDKNFLTAQNYFLEALDGFCIEAQFEEASRAAKYLILCAIVDNKNVESVVQKINDKIATFTKKANIMDDPVVKILVNVHKCYAERDLVSCQEILSANEDSLVVDEFLVRHLRILFKKLFKQNILKIIEPFSCVNIKYVADQLGIAEDLVESTIRDMILDDQLHGIIDHINRNFIVKDKKVVLKDTRLDVLDDLIKYTEDML